MGPGILSYGIYIPKYRLKIEEIEKAWPHKEYSTRSKRFGVQEKAVAGFDEDVVTMAFEALRNALNRIGLQPTQLKALITGSMCHGYKDKSISAALTQMFGISDVFACDSTHSSKSGTSALLLGSGLVKSGMDLVAIVSSDDPRTEPCSDLEPFSGAGAAAYILADENYLAELEASYSYSSEVYDIWSPNDMPYICYDMGVTQNLYSKTVTKSSLRFLEIQGKDVSYYDHIVLSQPETRSAKRMTRTLMATEAQLSVGLLCDRIGNTYSSSPLVGLASVLDQAKEGERILLASYGSGCSDVLSLQVKKEKPAGKDGLSVIDFLENKIYIDYMTYLQFRGII